MIFRKLTAWLAMAALAGPALAGSNLPLVTQSGQTRQLPTGTTLATQPSTTGAASLNIPAGTAPTSPVDGDIWTTTGGIVTRINGVTAGPLAPLNTANTWTGAQTITEAGSGGFSMAGRTVGGTFSATPLTGTFNGYDHNNQDGFIFASDDDAVQTSNLYAINRMASWITARSGFNTPQAGSAIGLGIDLQIYNSTDTPSGYSPTGRREFGNLLIATSAFPYSGSTYSKGGNYWHIDSTAAGPVQASSADREQWLSGGVLFTKKRAPGNTMDSTHDGSVGLLISSTPCGGAGDAANDCANLRTSYMLDAGLRVHGWSGAYNVASGSAVGATPHANYGAWIGGAGADVWAGYSARSLYHEAYRGEDFDTYGLHLLNGYTGANAAYIEPTAGGVGIWQAPQTAIPLLVGSAGGGLTARLYNSNANATQLQIERFSASPAANDVLTEIDHMGFTSTGAEVTYARSLGIISSPTNASYTGTYKIQTAQNAAMADALTVSGANTTFAGTATTGTLISSSVGTPTTNTGTCTTIGAATGGALAGAFTLSSSCANGSTVNLTFSTTAAHGWVCDFQDMGNALVIRQTAYSATSCTGTFLATSGASDVIVYTAIAF